MIGRYRRGTLVLEIVLIAAALAFLFPLLILINVAFKPSSEALRDPLALPTSLDLENFRTAWTQGDLGAAVVNSATVAALSVLLLVLLGSTTAYFFARRMTRVSNALYFLVLLGLMIPLQLGMVPLYRLMHSAGLLGTYTSLILFYAGTQLPFTVFLYAGFLRATPRDYEEAAFLDGAGWWRTFWFVVFPLVRPVTITVVLLDIIDVWKDFLTPLLYVGGSEQQTLPVAVYAFRGEFVSQWGVIFAGVIISVIPVMVLYVVLQRFIIGGFAGGLKG
ncbi:MAG: carbohydrate ABC transporter permease [Protaetiibacter sp.]